ncbi:MAG: hypothetical protein HFG11_04440 [Oscillibacter sp.]|nr:hypothetical protein [Oscillibacter sp.]
MIIWIFRKILRPCLENVKTPKRQPFFRRSALIFLAMHKAWPHQIALIGEKTLAVGHSAIYQTRPRHRNMDGKFSNDHMNRSSQPLCAERWLNCQRPRPPDFRGGLQLSGMDTARNMEETPDKSPNKLMESAFSQTVPAAREKGTK